MSRDYTPEARAALAREPLYCSQGGIPYNKPHLDAKDAEIERLRAALKPFVDFDWFHGEGDDVFSDNHVLLSWGKLTTGDLRKARAALANR